MQQVRVDQHAEHAEGLVILDEPHAAHVGGEVVDDRGFFAGLLAGFLFLQVELQVLDAAEFLIPLIKRFDVDGPDVCVPWRSRSATRWPPINPPAPHTTIFWSFMSLHSMQHFNSKKHFYPFTFGPNGMGV